MNYLVLTTRAFIHSLHSRHDKAIGDLSQAIALDPSNADLYIDRGRAWLSLNEHKRAIDDFTGAIRLNPDAEAYLERGDVYTQMKKYDKAIEDYERAVTLRPDAKAYTARGALYHLLNRLSDAMAISTMQPCLIVPLLLHTQSGVLSTSNKVTTRKPLRNTPKLSA